MSIATSIPNTSEATAARGAGNGQVMAALRQASQRTGADFSYLVAKCAQESSFNPEAKASTSSATGLFQFIDGTWLSMVERYGAKHGLGAEAARIERRADGSVTVADPKARQQILDLRKDPTVSALMAGEYARENKMHLQQEVGGQIGSTDLYMAHFLGAGGAAKFLSAMRENPSRKAAALLPEAASANRAVFYDASGQARSLGDIYDRFAAKFEGRSDAAATRMAASGVGEGAAGGGFETAKPGAFGSSSSIAAFRGVTQAAGEPLPYFTVMMLSQLGTPGDKAADRDDPARLPQQAAMPNLGAG
ncbi:transglycosylase SLT domain-containing protein [Arenibaculum pallidiluteum]|uniref:transglycosylase SLT domain-containing protein n=1 Tax=Arenibaculum pallidiluteum TaxID=2812559 RepID=UPI001A964D5F|nr:transglycosylase SLT domain-containing protein [Arenibaculum pallidiluteum]